MSTTPALPSDEVHGSVEGVPDPLVTPPRRGRTPRGRHATSAGEAFGFVVTWTIIGAALPGIGLLAAGRRVFGWILLALTVVPGVAFGLYLLLSGNAMNTAMSLRDVVLDPRWLLYLAVGIGVAGFLWALVIVGTHVALRRHAAVAGAQRLLAAALVLALVTAVGVSTAMASNLALIQRNFLTSVFTAVEPPDAEPVVPHTDPWANKPRVNVLLLGSDYDDDRIGVRPDTVILASINTKTGDTVLLSLPRNLERVPFPPGTPGAIAWPEGFYCVNTTTGSHDCLLNAVWTWGEDHRSEFPGDKSPGLTATRQAVQGVLGIRPDYFVMLNIKGFAALVQALGGVHIDVPRDIPIGGGKSLSGAQNPITGWIRKGENRHLDGFQALWFARSREGSDDYDRMERQRCMIGAITSEADPLNIVQNFSKIARAVKNNFQTDIPLSRLSAWGDLAVRIKDAQVRSLPFTPKVYGSSGDPDYAKMQALAQQALRAPVQGAPEPSPSTSPPAPTTTSSTTTSATRAPTGMSSSTTGPKPDVAQNVESVC